MSTFAEKMCFRLGYILCAIVQIAALATDVFTKRICLRGGPYKSVEIEKGRTKMLLLIRPHEVGFYSNTKSSKVQRDFSLVSEENMK